MKKGQKVKRWKGTLKATYDTPPGRKETPKDSAPLLRRPPNSGLTVLRVKFVIVCVILEADSTTGSFPKTTTPLLPVGH